MKASPNNIKEHETRHLSIEHHRQNRMHREKAYQHASTHIAWRMMHVSPRGNPRMTTRFSALFDLPGKKRARNGHGTSSRRDVEPAVAMPLGCAPASERAFISWLLHRSAGKAEEKTRLGYCNCSRRGPRSRGMRWDCPVTVLVPVTVGEQ